MKYTVQSGQSVVDVTIQLYGTIEKLVDFLNDNNLGLNSKLKSGQVVEYDEDEGNEKAKKTITVEKLNFNNNQQTLSEAGITGGDFNNDFNNDYLI